MSDKNTKINSFEKELFKSLAKTTMDVDIKKQYLYQHNKNSLKNLSTKNKIVDISDDKDFSGNIDDWNVSNIKEMKELFLQDISNWDFSKVKDMREVFLQDSNDIYSNNVYSYNTLDKNNDINLDSATGLYNKKNIFKNMFEEEKTKENKLSAFHRMIVFFKNLFLSNKKVEKEIVKIEVITKKPDFPPSDEFQSIYNQMIEKIHSSSSLFPAIVIENMSSLKNYYYKILENLDSLDESNKREVSKSIRDFLPKLIDSYIAIPLIEINGENSNQLKAQKILVEGIEEITANMKETVLTINELKLSELSVVTRTIRATLN